MSEATLARVEVDGMEVAYAEAGEGDPVILLHGWPTSSFLWRQVIPVLAAGNRVVAPDLPGFGESSKPLDRRYDFELFEFVLDGLTEQLGIEAAGLAVHDLGGPIGVHWALGRPGRVSRLAVLNTLLYPEFDPTVAAFVTTLADPARREQLTGPDGLAAVLRLGFADEAHVTDEALAGFRAPFANADSRSALAHAGIELRPEGFAEIAEGLPGLDIPVRVVYGEADRILPDIGETVRRLAADIPHAEVVPIPGCGHWVQEEAPERVSELLAEFFS